MVFFRKTYLLLIMALFFSNIQNQLEIFPQEKLFLHIDKSSYISGEKIWFCAYPVDESYCIPDSGNSLNLCRIAGSR